MSIDFRALCAELLDNIVFGRLDASTAANPERLREVITRVRAALDQSAVDGPTAADFRALCAELVSRWDNANGDQDLCGLADIMDRARSALDQSAAAESLSPREVEAQEAFTKMRDVILSLSDGLEVNKVLRIIDNHTPEWV